MTRVRPLLLQAHPTTPHGHALIDLSQVWNSADGYDAEIEVVIGRQQDYLQAPANRHANEAWGTTQDKLLLRKFGNEEQPCYELGPELIDPLLESGLPNFTAQAYRRGETTPFYVGHVICKNLLPSSSFDASAKAAPPVTPEPPPVAPSVTPSAEPDPIAHSEPAPSPSPKKKSKGVLIAVVLVVLALLAAIAAALFFWLNSNKVDNLAEPGLDESAIDTITLAACDLNQLNQQSETEFLQTCLQGTPESTALLSVIQQAAQADKCSIAQRLYANRSQAGDLIIAGAYVKEYDPKYHTASTCFKEPNTATAIYWYETILMNDPENTEAQQRLDELKP